MSKLCLLLLPLFIFSLSCKTPSGCKDTCPKPPKKEKQEKKEVTQDINIFDLIDLFEDDTIEPTEPDDVIDVPDVKKKKVKNKYSKLLDYNVSIKKSREADPHCSGTIVKSNKWKTLVLTAFHCVDDQNTKEPIPFGFVDNGKEVYRFKVKKYSRKNDLALLRITDKCPIQPSAKLSLKDVDVGDEVVMVGNPGGEEDVLSKGVVAKLNMKSWYKTPVTCFEITGYYGSSGSAIYNKNNRIIAVLTEYGPQGGGVSGWMYGVKWSVIKNFLK